MVIVQSLWVGNTLSNMEVCCINSFLKHGFIFHLYTYESVKRVPKGTIIKDANEIMPAKEIFDELVYGAEQALSRTTNLLN